MYAHQESEIVNYKILSNYTKTAKSRKTLITHSLIKKSRQFQQH